MRGSTALAATRARVSPLAAGSRAGLGWAGVEPAAALPVPAGMGNTGKRSGIFRSLLSSLVRPYRTFDALLNSSRGVRARQPDVLELPGNTVGCWPTTMGILLPSIAFINS